MKTYVFNGDADGLCALQQLRLEEPGPARLVSGPKRKTALVAEVEAGRGDQVTVLDVSLAANREAVERLLEAGARVRYFDHHYAGAPLEHPRFEAHIDPAPELCTSAIVDRHLRAAHRAWAVAGAFGDNLDETARRLAEEANIRGGDLETLRRLGIALNYNGYGESEADLLVAPVELHARLAPHRHPLGFVGGDALFERLCGAYEEDMHHVAALAPHVDASHAALYVLPDAPWARRVAGAFANRLSREAPARAHAVLIRNGEGGYLVSVRAPLERPSGAVELCLAFAGGGRAAAAGVNHLPADEVDAFAQRFLQHFR